MSIAAHRHLLEQRWRSEGALDLLVRSSVAFRLVLGLNTFLDGTNTPNECSP